MPFTLPLWHSPYLSRSLWAVAQGLPKTAMLRPLQKFILDPSRCDELKLIGILRLRCSCTRCPSRSGWTTRVVDIDVNLDHWLPLYSMILPIATRRSGCCSLSKCCSSSPPHRWRLSLSFWSWFTSHFSLISILVILLTNACWSCIPSWCRQRRIKRGEGEKRLPNVLCYSL